jgi:hypothetical protein
MTLSFNPDGSTRSTSDESFKHYVYSVWETEAGIDLDDFDPDDIPQIRRWVAEWEADDEAS